MKPEITTTEDTRCLTDRWGQMLDLDPPASEEERAIVESLLASMYDEDTFIVRRGEVYGVLLEIEYDDDLAPTDGDADAMVALRVAHPGVAFYYTQGGHTFNDRVAFRAFLPAFMACPQMSEIIGVAMNQIMYH